MCSWELNRTLVPKNTQPVGNPRYGICDDSTQEGHTLDPESWHGGGEEGTCGACSSVTPHSFQVSLTIVRYIRLLQFNRKGNWGTSRYIFYGSLHSYWGLKLGFKPRRVWLHHPHSNEIVHKYCRNFPRNKFLVEIPAKEKSKVTDRFAFGALSAIFLLILINSWPTMVRSDKFHDQPFWPTIKICYHSILIGDEEHVTKATKYCFNLLNRHLFWTTADLSVEKTSTL